MLDVFLELLVVALCGLKSGCNLVKSDCNLALHLVNNGGVVKFGYSTGRSFCFEVLCEKSVVSLS